MVTKTIHVCSFVKVNFSRGLLYALSFNIIFHIDYVMIRFANRGHPFNSIDWLFLIGSVLYLQVMNTYMRTCLSLKFGQTQPLVSMVTDRVMMGKNGVSTFSRLCFIRSFSYLQVTMTCMRARMTSNFSLIGPPTAELATKFG